MSRAYIRTFAIANDAYVGATITFYTVVAGAKTTTLATLYSAQTGTGTLGNPQTLDSDGKLKQPVYVDESVVATITGLSITDHDTGILGAEVLATEDAAYRAQTYVAAAQAAFIYTDDAKRAARTAQTAAETAETNAELAEVNAETAETNAETAETNAAASAAAAVITANAAEWSAAIAAGQASIAAQEARKSDASADAAAASAASVDAYFLIMNTQVFG